MAKARHLDAYGAKDQRRDDYLRVGKKADQAKAEDKSLRVKSSLRGSNTSVERSCGF